MASHVSQKPLVAEFFAGIGLVRTALDQVGFRVAFANDVSSLKLRLYAANGPSSHFLLRDIHSIGGQDIPTVQLATASFPCVDLSLAGNRAGLNGIASGTFWQFVRVLHEMEGRRPTTLLIENVQGFANSHHGEDLATVLLSLNQLGYICDVMLINASHFLPQSRPRLFIVGHDSRLPDATDIECGPMHPEWLIRALSRDPRLKLQAKRLPQLPHGSLRLNHVVERLQPSDDMWWDASRVTSFVASLSAIQSQRLEMLRMSDGTSWATAYRRTRRQKPVWEIRADGLSGCLRAVTGGSSKQALVEAGDGQVRIRWMTPREYARLQGVPDFDFDDVPENRALFALGDAVCVPVVAWLAENYLLPMLQTARSIAV